MPFKYPRIVEYTASLPKTGTGKIDRQALQKDSLQKDSLQKDSLQKDSPQNSGAVA
jgi:acyl-coenzyme A synthetase/AMP-(fatty) acid ligase